MFGTLDLSFELHRDLRLWPSSLEREVDSAERLSLWPTREAVCRAVHRREV